LCEFVHFCCTSEDINNLSYSLMLQRFLDIEFIPEVNFLQKKLNSLAKKYSKLSMLAFTHGQPASPTTLGKEFSNYIYRVKFHLDLIKSIKQKGKFNGASGNYNAHVVAEKKVNWETLSKKFVNSLGLDFSSHSTQIELKDAMAFQLANAHNLNNVLIDFAQDIWLLISKNYLKQNLKAGEVGSSTMPHKVNPIDFENAEGNLAIANGLIIALKNKIQISRLQRDLSDSTVLRNIGSLFAYIIISLNSLKKGIAKIVPNKELILKELDNSWEILTEAIQTILRKNGVEDSYIKIKSISRGKKLDYHSYIKIIDDLKINNADKELLLSLTPKKYIGLADKLAKSSFKS
ncbi:MAG: adenylosuccinate lyase, partial [SAR86 cluster bacterium]|nr:adenylosuccinate lyase [SAR86 cluster bacterium]